LQILAWWRKNLLCGFQVPAPWKDKATSNISVEVRSFCCGYVCCRPFWDEVLFINNGHRQKVLFNDNSHRQKVLFIDNGHYQ
jgi:hypothetical protein